MELAGGSPVPQGWAFGQSRGARRALRDRGARSHNRAMTSRRGRMSLVLAPLLLSAIAAFGACNDDPTHFGPAGGLAGRTPDDQVPASDAGSSGTSGTTEGGSSGCAPGTPDAGCPSFATDIFTPMLAAAGTYKCGNTASCHGAGGAAPAPMTDPAGTLTLFKT